MQQGVFEAFWFTLGPTPAQVDELSRHAGAARWVFNDALGVKVAAHQQWRGEVDAPVDSGVAEARKRVCLLSFQADAQKHLNQVKGDPRTSTLPEGAHGPRPCPWWLEVNTYAVQSAFIDDDRPWRTLARLPAWSSGRAAGGAICGSGRKSCIGGLPMFWHDQTKVGNSTTPVHVAGLRVSTRSGHSALHMGSSAVHPCRGAPLTCCSRSAARVGAGWLVRRPARRGSPRHYE
ncbi:helix-turn-helix domain-containing protein [Streptomyces sp. SCSIO 30461]|uniref:helix-turn-helix domain-containing protein n=1 Tax=Streptomyces sp. SCSIO 30461 TaxID=3118085 RepID=UPI00387ED663